MRLGLPPVKISPNEGWGFFERDTDELAPTFEAEVKESGRTPYIYERGWVGKVTSKKHRYSAMELEMSPRHTAPWTKFVVVKVFDGNKSLKSSLVFSGMAETENLKCDWL